MTEVVVIGGGIIGVSVAYRLAVAGASVTLLEANELASGTSRTSFAWMNSNNKTPLAYHRLNTAGMAEHLALRDEFGSVPWLHLVGNLIWESPSRKLQSHETDVPIHGEALDAKVDRLRRWNYPVDVIPRAEIVQRHPELNPPPDLERAVWFPSEGYVDVPLLVANLAQAARQNGARIETNRRVVGIHRTSGRVSGVTTNEGERISANVVVSCAGRWTDHIMELASIKFPMVPTLGMLVTTTKVATAQQSLVHAPGVNLRPDGGSRFLLASYEIDALLRGELSQETLTQLAEIILHRAKSILPSLCGSSVESFVIGIRSIPADGFPVVGSVPGVDGLYVVATHSGITMGPLLGRLAAQEVLGSSPDELLSTFRPDRFLM